MYPCTGNHYNSHEYNKWITSKVTFSSLCMDLFIDSPWT